MPISTPSLYDSSSTLSSEWSVSMETEGDTPRDTSSSQSSYGSSSISSNSSYHSSVTIQRPTTSPVLGELISGIKRWWHKQSTVRPRVAFHEKTFQSETTSLSETTSHYHSIPISTMNRTPNKVTLSVEQQARSLRLMQGPHYIKRAEFGMPTERLENCFKKTSDEGVEETPTLADFHAVAARNFVGDVEIIELGPVQLHTQEEIERAPQIMPGWHGGLRLQPKVTRRVGVRRKAREISQRPGQLTTLVVTCCH
eukprot:Blabericola_migrator_1__4601@NODE_2440_length_2756_cov_61_828933_g1528_i0_p2_GENE_NODE_2440_length_2756_cov_61_828933_g1528_i0NODE_2440_length_2756_cov_61_828933_g1528_i0_p2_ORF_typecomplete_len254_score43_55_NODE_2440_length_2756_cov_61_828933_g1528_i019142675